MSYRRFMVYQWLPAALALGLEPLELYFTVWGRYPIRMTVLYAASAKILYKALNSKEWEMGWQQLQDYVDNLDFCIVPARNWFQFCEHEVDPE